MTLNDETIQTSAEETNAIFPPMSDSTVADQGVKASSTTSLSRKFPKKFIAPAIAVLLMLIGVGVALALNSATQDLRQQASGGYADCAGGLKDGQKTCSGLRGLSQCHNGVLTSMGSCNASEKCEAGSCVVLAASSTPPSAAPSPAPVGACRNGLGLLSTYVTNSSECIQNGDRYFECNAGFRNENYGCVSITQAGRECGDYQAINNCTCPAPKVSYVGYCFPSNINSCTMIDGKCQCAAGSTTSVADPGVCGARSGALYKITGALGQQRCEVCVGDTSGCNYSMFDACESQVNSLNVTNQYNLKVAQASACRSGSGLFSGQGPQPAHSNFCNRNGAGYFECINGYVNQNNGCIPVPTISSVTPVTGFKIVGTLPNLTCTSCAATEDTCFYRTSEQCVESAVSQIKNAELLSQVIPPADGTCRGTGGLMDTRYVAQQPPNSSRCTYNNLTYFECAENFTSQNNTCVPSSTLLVKWRVVGEGANNRCEQCAPGSTANGCVFASVDVCISQLAQDRLNLSVDGTGRSFDCYDPTNSCTQPVATRMTCLTNEQYTPSACEMIRSVADQVHASLPGIFGGPFSGSVLDGDASLAPPAQR